MGNVRVYICNADSEGWDLRVGTYDWVLGRLVKWGGSTSRTYLAILYVPVHT